MRRDDGVAHTSMHLCEQDLSVGRVRELKRLDHLLDLLLDISRILHGLRGREQVVLQGLELELLDEVLAGLLFVPRVLSTDRGVHQGEVLSTRALSTGGVGSNWELA